MTIRFARRIAFAVCAMVFCREASAEFTNRWNSVTTLPRPEGVSYLDGTLDDKGFTCKIRLERYTDFTLWTTNYSSKPNSNWGAVSLDTSAVTISKGWSDASNALAKTSFNVTKDTDGNYRATLSRVAWSKDDPKYVSFYFQFQGKQGSVVSLAYSGAVVEETVLGTKERPKPFTFYRSTTPKTLYGTESGKCSTNGEYWISSELTAGRRYFFGPSLTCADEVRFGAYYPDGSQINTDELQRYKVWSDIITNIEDQVQYITNTLERTIVTTEYISTSNEVLTATNVYTVVGIYTNDVGGSQAAMTNLMAVVTNVDWQAESVRHVISETTNHEWEVLSVFTNMVTVTNILHAGICRDAWVLVPKMSGCYSFVFLGEEGSSSAFSLCHAVSPADSLSGHDAKDYGKIDGHREYCVPGFINNYRFSAYDAIINSNLYRIPTLKGSSYSFSVSDADTDILLRIYDSSGRILSEATSPGNGHFDVDIVKAASEQVMYAGIAMKPIYGDSMQELGLIVGYTNGTVRVGESNVWEQVLTGYTVESSNGGAVTNQTYVGMNVSYPIYADVSLPVYAMASNEVSFSVSKVSDVSDFRDPVDDKPNGLSPNGKVAYSATVIRPSRKLLATSGNLFVWDPADWYAFTVDAGDEIEVSVLRRCGGNDVVIVPNDAKGVDVKRGDSSFTVTASASATVYFKVTHADMSAPQNSSYDVKYVKLASASAFDGNYAFDVDGQPFSGASRTEYNGWVADGEGIVRGTFQIKAAAMNRQGNSILSGYVLLSSGGRKTVKGSIAIGSARDDGTPCRLSGSSMSIDVLLTADGIVGETTNGLCLYGVRNFAKDKTGALRNAANAWLSKTFVFAMSTASASGAYADLSSGYSCFSVQIKPTGKARVEGLFADGTRASASTMLLAGKEFCVVPILMSAYSKRGGFGCLLWLYADGSVKVDNASEWDASKSRTPFSAVLETVAGPAIPPRTFSGSIAVESLPEGVALAKNIEDIRVRYTAASGVLRATVPCLVEHGGKSMRKSASFTGIVSDGTGYGSMVLRSILSVPVEVNPK